MHLKQQKNKTPKVCQRKHMLDILHQGIKRTFVRAKEKTTFPWNRHAFLYLTWKLNTVIWFNPLDFSTTSKSKMLNFFSRSCFASESTVTLKFILFTTLFHFTQVIIVFTYWCATFEVFPYRCFVHDVLHLHRVLSCVIFHPLSMCPSVFACEYVSDSCSCVEGKAYLSIYLSIYLPFTSLFFTLLLFTSLCFTSLDITWYDTIWYDMIWCAPFYVTRMFC